MHSSSMFTSFAKGTSRAAGQPTTFVTAVLIILVWSSTGPIFRFSDTWQLVINIGTTIITFLMVFLIQNTQNRDSEASLCTMGQPARTQKMNKVAKCKRFELITSPSISCPSQPL